VYAANFVIARNLLVFVRVVVGISVGLLKVDVGVEINTGK